MGALFLLVLVVILLFGFVLLFGAPYLPTLYVPKQQALDLLDLKPGETMLELGCGDGRVLKAAAVRGWCVIGYELNPLLALIARLNTWRYRTRVKVIWGNFWRRPWPTAQGIFVFLLPRYMQKLDKKITRSYSGKSVKLVSFAFAIPGKKPLRRVKGVYLYRY